MGGKGAPVNYAVKSLQAAATDWADREAIIHHRERISFGTLARRTAHLAAQLGAEQGAVAVLSRNQPQALISHLACHMAGRPVAHIPRDAGRAGQESFLRETGAARLFFDVREAAAAEALAASVPGVQAEAMDHSTPDAFRFADDGGPPVPQAPASAVRLLLGTGGTTGVPKGVVHTHALIDSLTAAGEDDAAALLRLVPAEAITHMMFTPPQMSQLLDAPGCADADLSTLRSVTYGAAPSDRKRVEQALERFGPVIRQAYGATESGLITLLAPEDHLRDDPGIRYSVGRPVGGARIAVRDPSGVAVPTGESGEVWVTGPAMTEGYLSPARCGDPVERGWLRTGDLGRISADGYLTLDGRVKELTPIMRPAPMSTPGSSRRPCSPAPKCGPQRSAPPPTPRSTATASTPPSPRPTGRSTSSAFAPTYGPSSARTIWSRTGSISWPACRSPPSARSTSRPWPGSSAPPPEAPPTGRSEGRRRAPPRSRGEQGPSGAPPVPRGPRSPAVTASCSMASRARAFTTEDHHRLLREIGATNAKHLRAIHPRTAGPLSPGSERPPRPRRSRPGSASPSSASKTAPASSTWPSSRTPTNGARTRSSTTACSWFAAPSKPPAPAPRPCPCRPVADDPRRHRGRSHAPLE